MDSADYRGIDGLPLETLKILREIFHRAGSQTQISGTQKIV
jgi:hypothetical protein